MIKSIWNSFKTKPLKFGVGVLAVSISVYIFFGDVSLHIEHDKTKLNLSTKGAK